MEKSKSSPKSSAKSIVSARAPYLEALSPGGFSPNSSFRGSAVSPTNLRGSYRSMGESFNGLFREASMKSTMTYDSNDEKSLKTADFELAPEHFHDTRLQSIGGETKAAKKSSINLLTLDKFAKTGGEMPQETNKLGKLRISEHRTRNAQQTQLELETIKLAVTYFPMESKRRRQKNKLDIQECENDIREEMIESWCAKRGKPIKMKHEDKRRMRNWFRQLDHDESGEVTVDELQDPMISAGILKTREQVVRVLNNLDKNKTAGVDFEEFVGAINSNGDATNIKKLKALQQIQSNTAGFSVDTLITEERRKKLMRCIITTSEKRNRELDFALIKLGHNRTQKSEDSSWKVLAALEAKHSRSMRLNDKYIGSLGQVLQKKINNQQQADRVKQLNFENGVDSPFAILKSTSRFKDLVIPESMTIPAPSSPPQLTSTANLAINTNFGTDTATGTTTGAGLGAGIASGNFSSVGAATINATSFDGVIVKKGHLSVIDSEQPFDSHLPNGQFICRQLPSSASVWQSAYGKSLPKKEFLESNPYSVYAPSTPDLLSVTTPGVIVHMPPPKPVKPTHISGGSGGGSSSTPTNTSSSATEARIKAAPVMDKRREKYRTSLPAAPPVSSQERSEFGKLLREPLNKDLLEKPVSMSSEEKFNRK